MLRRWTLSDWKKEKQFGRHQRISQLSQLRKPLSTPRMVLTSMRSKPVSTVKFICGWHWTSLMVQWLLIKPSSSTTSRLSSQTNQGRSNLSVVGHPMLLEEKLCLLLISLLSTTTAFRHLSRERQESMAARWNLSTLKLESPVSKIKSGTKLKRNLKPHMQVHQATTSPHKHAQPGGLSTLPRISIWKLERSTPFMPASVSMMRSIRHSLQLLVILTLWNSLWMEPNSDLLSLLLPSLLS